jgi:hypothetical protein
LRVDCALLCDAATVREGLLHILGGGVTRLNRPQFPAPLATVLALRILVHPTEVDRSHHLTVQLNDADGQRLVNLDADFGVSDASVLEPGEEASVPFPLALPPNAALPHQGRYSFEVLIDGIHQVSVPFSAVTIDLPQQPPQPPGDQ